MNELGQFISKKRQERNLTQKELAERLHIHVTTISKWENGNSTPNVNYYKELANALDIPVIELFECMDEGKECAEISDEDKTVIEDGTKHKAMRKYMIIMLVVLVVGLSGIAAVMLAKNNAQPKVQVVEEFLMTDADYFEYNNVYYIIVEYDGNVSSEFVKSYRSEVRISFEEQFEKAELLIVLFFDTYSDIDAINEADFELVLYPSMIEK